MLHKPLHRNCTIVCSLVSLFLAELFTDRRRRFLTEIELRWVGSLQPSGSVHTICPCAFGAIHAERHAPKRRESREVIDVKNLGW